MRLVPVHLIVHLTQYIANEVGKQDRNTQGFLTKNILKAPPSEFARLPWVPTLPDTCILMKDTNEGSIVDNTD